MNGFERWLFAIAVALELFGMTTTNQWVSALAGVIFLAGFLLAGRRLQVYARGLLLVALVASAVLAFQGYLSSSQLLKASADAAFYATFLGSLGMMQCLVRRFDVLRRIHDVLLGGRAALLYPKYALVSCGVASVLNFGMMNLLCGTLSETLDERGITGQSRLRWLRCVLVSALRGFALVPLVAPTSVAVAILTRELPELSWVMLLPFGILAAMALILIGWMLEKHRFREVSDERVALERWPAGTFRLLKLVMIIFSAMAILVSLTDLKVSAAAMLVVPAITLAYMIWQDRSPVSVVREGASQIGSMMNEMAIFAASAILGVAFSGLIPKDALEGLAVSGTGLWLISSAGLLMLPLFSAIGVIPITVLSLQVGLLPTLIAQGVDPLPISVALMIGFSLAMMLSPFGPSVMLLSRFGRVSRWEVAFRWNGLFVLIAVPLLLLFLGLIVF